MDSFETLATVQNGVLLLAHVNAFNAALAAFPDGEVHITVRRAYATRTRQQNKFYWSALVDPIAARSGMTPREAHEVLKQKFLPAHVTFFGNGELRDDTIVGGSTRTLTVREFGDYCDAIRVWALEFFGMDLEEAPYDGE